MTEELKQFLKQVKLFSVAKAAYVTFRRLRGKLVRAKKISRYLASTKTPRLHLGCGQNILPGWLNTDLDPAPGAVFLDITKPVPFDDAVFDHILCEHLIEHVRFHQGLRMLSECFRILKPGGKIRIATPDLQFLIDLYQKNKTPLQQRYITWALDTYLPDIKNQRDIFVINNFFRDWGHRFIYDRRLLTDAMTDIGFVNITPCEIGKSSDQNFRNLEAHEQIIPDEFNKLETFVLEGAKPN